MSSYEVLAGRLEAVLADLDDLAFDELREAVADGATSRPHSDRELAKVRRSVEKAARLLQALDATDATQAIEVIERPETTGGYVSGPAAATEPRRLALERVAHEDRIVLVEGVTDQIAIETLAARCGRGLDGTVVAPMGGAHAIGTFLEAIAVRDGAPIVVGGLCDRREAAVFSAALTRAGYGPVTSDAELEHIGFFVCDSDLEAELIRSVGSDRVVLLLEQNGDIGAFHTLQKQGAWSTAPIEEQLHRFLRVRARRMHRYARLLIEAVDPEEAPVPLLGLVELL